MCQSCSFFNNLSCEPLCFWLSCWGKKFSAENAQNRPRNGPNGTPRLISRPHEVQSRVSNLFWKGWFLSFEMAPHLWESDILGPRPRCASGARFAISGHFWAKCQNLPPPSKSNQIKSFGKSIHQIAAILMGFSKMHSSLDYLSCEKSSALPPTVHFLADQPKWPKSQKIRFQLVFLSQRVPTVSKSPWDLSWVTWMKFGTLVIRWVSWVGRLSTTGASGSICCKNEPSWHT